MPIYIAALAPKVYDELIKFLIAKHGGHLPPYTLHFAALNQEASGSVLKMFVEKAPELINKEGIAGITPLHIAMSVLISLVFKEIMSKTEFPETEKQVENINYLISKGADLKKKIDIKRLKEEINPSGKPGGLGTSMISEILDKITAEGSDFLPKGITPADVTRGYRMILVGLIDLLAGNKSTLNGFEMIDGLTEIKPNQVIALLSQFPPLKPFLTDEVKKQIQQFFREFPDKRIQDLKKKINRKKGETIRKRTKRRRKGRRKKAGKRRKRTKLRGKGRRKKAGKRHKRRKRRKRRKRLRRKRVKK